MATITQLSIPGKPHGGSIGAGPPVRTDSTHGPFSVGGDPGAPGGGLYTGVQGPPPPPPVNVGRGVRTAAAAAGGGVPLPVTPSVHGVESAGLSADCGTAVCGKIGIELGAAPGVPEQP